MSTTDLYSVNLATDVPIATKLDFRSLQQHEHKLLYHFLGSCNGLLLLSVQGNFPFFLFSQEKTSNLFLLNLSTRECDKLPPLPFVLDPGERGGFYMFGYGLGYDSSRDDYKVVMLSYHVSKSEFESVSSTLSDMTMVAVDSLKTNAWRRIQDAHYIPDRCTAGVYYNGCLHWLCRRDGSYLMFVLDLADEIFREVPLLASVVHDESVDFHEVVIVGDCLCLVCERDSGLVEVWMMMEFGVSASWSKVMIDIHDIINMYIHGLLAEDEFLLTGNTSREDKLVVYNPKKGKLRDIMVHGIPTSFFTRRTYVESLVSPNQCNHGEGTGKQG